MAMEARSSSKGTRPRGFWPKRRGLSQAEVGLKYGFRSGLEQKIADELKAAGTDYKFESVAIEYTKPARKSRYTPDFILPNGVIIETKGRFVTADRQKHIAIKEQHPSLDIRFVFSNANARISKKSATTYAMWCERYGFKYAHRSVPAEWTGRAGANEASAAALQRLAK